MVFQVFDTLFTEDHIQGPCRAFVTVEFLADVTFHFVPHVSLNSPSSLGKRTHWHVFAPSYGFPQDRQAIQPILDSSDFLCPGEKSSQYCSMIGQILSYSFEEYLLVIVFSQFFGGYLKHYFRFHASM
jgi:hypothetical protein